MMVEGWLGALMVSSGMVGAADAAGATGGVSGSWASQLTQGGIAVVVIGIGAYFLARSDRRERDLADQSRKERDDAHREHLALQEKYEALLTQVTRWTRETDR